MTAESYVEQMRVTQKQDDHVLTKHLGGYRTKDVDQYIDKMQNKLRNMEDLYQEKYEEMRTSLLVMTRERDTQSARANSLEEKIKDFPKYCDRYLEEKGLAAVPTEINDIIQDIDIDDLCNIKNIKAKLRLMENENLKHIKELEDAHIALDEAKSASKIVEQQKMQALTHNERINQLQLLLDAQKQQTKQALDELEFAKKTGQDKMIELVNEQSRYQTLELEHGLVQEKNQQLLREKEQLRGEADRQKELGNAQLRAVVQRFQKIIDNQKQYTRQMQQNMAAFLKYMDSLSALDMPEI